MSLAKLFYISRVKYQSPLFYDGKTKINTLFVALFVKIKKSNTPPSGNTLGAYKKEAPP